MAENKTKKTEISVDAFLDNVADETQRADSYTLIEMMKDITGEPPKMWGPSIVGFGEYHYKYESGHEGDICKVGFSPRKGNLSLYILPNLDDYASLLAKLGKYKAGKGCLYVKKLADVDLKVLREMIERAIAYLSVKYPATPTGETPAESLPKKKASKKS